MDDPYVLVVKHLGTKPSLLEIFDDCFFIRKFLATRTIIRIGWTY